MAAIKTQPLACSITITASVSGREVSTQTVEVEGIAAFGRLLEVIALALYRFGAGEEQGGG